MFLKTFFFSSVDCCAHAHRGPLPQPVLVHFRLCTVGHCLPLYMWTAGRPLSQCSTPIVYYGWARVGLSSTANARKARPTNAKLSLLVNRIISGQPFPQFISPSTLSGQFATKNISSYHITLLDLIGSQANFKCHWAKCECQNWGMD